MREENDKLDKKDGNEGIESPNPTEDALLNESKNEKEDTILSDVDTTTSDSSEPVEARNPSELVKEDKNEVEDEVEDTESHTAEALVAENNIEGTEAILSDEELESEDTDVEVDSDEEEEDVFAKEDLELPNYADFEASNLVSEAENLLKSESVNRIKEHIDSIRTNLLSQLNAEKEEKLKEFIESGGNAIDFEFIQPLREKFRMVYSEYRAKRKKFYQELEDKLQANLVSKQEIIEKLKELTNKDESIGSHFKEFNDLQAEWKNIGPVPRNESNDLWKTYHHHIDNFYSFIQINKELRDLDFKKNKEKKEKLISEAAALAKEENLTSAFKKLQTLHKKWKEIGPVEREIREEMWERFSEMTKALHEKREEWYEGLKEEREKLIAKKRELLGKVSSLPFHKIDTHQRWQDCIKGINAVREEFRKIGRVQHPDNDKVWEEFRGLVKQFNKAKNDFYKNLKKEHTKNLDRKRALVAKAEELKDSLDWKNATDEFKRIQADWKKIGHVPKSESDKIWKEFKSNCNHFFNRLTDFNKNKDKELEVNFAKKQERLIEIEGFDPRASKQPVEELKTIIKEWRAIGMVPRATKQIEQDFNKLIDSKFSELDLNRAEAEKIKFENKLEQLANEGLGELRREQDFLRRKIDEGVKELNQLENNINFFSSSSNSKSPLIKEVEKKIEQQKSNVQALKDKVSLIGKKIKSTLEPKEEKPEEPSSSEE